MGKLCDIERVIIILMEQTIEIKKRHQSKSAIRENTRKNTAKNYTQNYLKKKNILLTLKESGKKPNLTTTTTTTTSKRVVSVFCKQKKQTKNKYARLSFVETLRVKI